MTLRCGLACLGMIAACAGCGPAIPLEEVPSEPIAFIRQKASEGILGFDEFREAVRLENPEDPGTLEARMRTALALIYVPTGEIREVPDAGLGAVALDWSGDGTRLLIGRVDGARRRVDLYSWNRLTAVWDPISNVNATLGAAFGTGPVRLAWSAPVALSDGVGQGLFVFTDEEPSTGRMLALDARFPDVSRDGTEILYDTEPRRTGEDGRIMRASLAGGEPVMVTRGSYPRFSRNGEWIVFLRTRAGSTDVWIMRADGAGRRKVTNTSFPEEYPAISPDGRYVVYASSRGEEIETQLYLTRVSDGVEVQITHGGQNGRPIW